MISYVYNYIYVEIVPTQRSLIFVFFRKNAFKKCLAKTLISKYKKLTVDRHIDMLWVTQLNLVYCTFGFWRYPSDVCYATSCK